MNEFYCDCKAVGLDCFDIKDIRRHATVFNNFNDISSRLGQLKIAFENISRERADIAVYAYPAISGVACISAFNDLRFHLFSKKVKRHCISLCVTKSENDGSLSVCFYSTDDYEYVRGIFCDFVTRHKIPDLSGWEVSNFQ